MFYSKDETSVIHMADFSNFNSDVNNFQQGKIRVLLSANILTTILDKYTHFFNIFFLNLATHFPENIMINNNIIKMIEND